MLFILPMKFANLPIKKGIKTNFCRIGAGRDDKVTKRIKSIFNKERSTRLEGTSRHKSKYECLRKWALSGFGFFTVKL
jgi:hypothetical protein